MRCNTPFRLGNMWSDAVGPDKYRCDAAGISHRDKRGETPEKKALPGGELKPKRGFRQVRGDCSKSLDARLRQLAFCYLSLRKQGDDWMQFRDRACASTSRRWQTVLKNYKREASADRRIVGRLICRRSTCAQALAAAAGDRVFSPWSRDNAHCAGCWTRYAPAFRYEYRDLSAHQFFGDYWSSVEAT